MDASDSTDDGPAAELEVRWDLNYDGSFDIPYRTQLTLPVEAVYEPGLFVALAEVRDGTGYTDRALVRIVVINEVYQPPLPEAAPESTPEYGPEILSQDLAANPESEPIVEVRTGGCSTTGHRSPWACCLLVTVLLFPLTRRRKDCNRLPSMQE